MNIFTPLTVVKSSKKIVREFNVNGTNKYDLNQIPSSCTTLSDFRVSVTFEATLIKKIVLDQVSDDRVISNRSRRRRAPFDRIVTKTLGYFPLNLPQYQYFFSKIYSKWKKINFLGYQTRY